MKIVCLASSSAGNCYIIQNKQQVLMVEAGLDLRNTRSRLASLNLKLSDISAVLISHKHKDHCDPITVDRLRMSSLVLGNNDTIDYLRLTLQDTLNLVKFKNFEPFDIDNFRVRAFELNHDVEAHGFIIEDLENNEKLLFMNDTEYVRWNFGNESFDFIMIECNHLYDKIHNLEPHRQRTIKSHMELGTTIKTLKNVNLSNAKAIYLMHLSDQLSDEALMINEVQAATGIPTYACLKNGGFSY